MAGLLRQKSAAYLGLVTAKNVQAVKVRVSQMERDTFLNMYFTEFTDYWAVDSTETAKEGDVVLIKQMDTPKSDSIEHQVQKIVYPIGHIIDPITGRRCRGPKFVDDNLRGEEPLKVYEK